MIALGDDDSRQFTLPFAFPFYGATYRQVFLNSDGNLTFTAGGERQQQPLRGPHDRRTAADFAAVRRSRPLPTRRQRALLCRREPRGLQLGERAGIWTRRPADLSGAPVRGRQHSVLLLRRQSFQRRGRDRAGIRPGRAPAWSRSTTTPRRNTPRPWWSASATRRKSISSRLAQKFYETHEDAYDYLVIYNNMRHRRERRRAGLRVHGAFQRHAATASRRRTMARSTGRRRACGV